MENLIFPTRRPDIFGALRLMYVPIRTFSAPQISSSVCRNPDIFDTQIKVCVSVRTFWQVLSLDGLELKILKSRRDGQDGRKERQALLDGRGVQHHGCVIHSRAATGAHNQSTLSRRSSCFQFLADPAVHTPSIRIFFMSLG